VKRAAAKPVFDASAALALLQDEPGSDKLRKLQPEAAMNAVNAAEVLAKLLSHGMPPEEAHAALDALHLEIIPFDSTLAGISARFVQKGVSLGDRCFLASCSRDGHGWTSDHEISALFEKHRPPLSFFR
jgi:PIN domain nuclease of toxin-antitoxin system